MSPNTSAPKARRNSSAYGAAAIRSTTAARAVGHFVRGEQRNLRLLGERRRAAVVREAAAGSGRADAVRIVEQVGVRRREFLVAQRRHRARAGRSASRRPAGPRARSPARTRDAGHDRWRRRSCPTPTATDRRTSAARRSAAGLRVPHAGDGGATAVRCRAASRPRAPRRR